MLRFSMEHEWIGERRYMHGLSYAHVHEEKETNSTPTLFKISMRL
jgi:hypothetical protein